MTFWAWLRKVNWDHYMVEGGNKQGAGRRRWGRGIGKFLLLVAVMGGVYVRQSPRLTLSLSKFRLVRWLSALNV